MKENFIEFIQLLEEGDPLKAIDLFFDDHVVQIENTDPPVKGKQTLRDHEIKNLAAVHSVKMIIPNYLFDEDKMIGMGEMLVHFHSKTNGKLKIEQAFFQKWKNGKIIYQRFYFKGFLKDEE